MRLEQRVFVTADDHIDVGATSDFLVFPHRQVS